MISDQDITKLKGLFATKEDLQSLKYEVGDLRVELGEVKDSVGEIHVKLDRFLGRLDTVDLDNAVSTVTYSRHTRQIEALATHVGFTLPE